MSQAATTQTKPVGKPAATNTAEPDVLPEIADDAEPASDVGRSDDAPGEGGSEAEPQRRPQPFKDDARARAAQRYRELRDEADAKEKAEQDADQGDSPAAAQDGTSGGDNEQAATPQAEGTEGASEEPAAADAEKGAQPAADKITLIVDGRPVAMDKDEVVRLAQIARASDNRLEESKRILKEAQETAKALRGQAPEHRPGSGGTAQDQPDPSQGDGSGTEHQPDTDAPEKRRTKLKAIVQRIQVGDEDDGAEALDELLTEVGGSKKAPDVGQLVQQHVAHIEAEKENKAAYQRFADKYDHIVKKPVVMEAAAAQLRMEIITDLEAAGVEREAIDKVRNNTQALGLAHKNLRVAGHKLRSSDELLGAAGDAITKEFNLGPAKAVESKPISQSPASKTPPPRVQASPEQVRLREDRKRAAIQQPRTAGVRGAVQQPPRPKTTQEVIRDMRAQRGFRT